MNVIVESTEFKTSNTNSITNTLELIPPQNKRRITVGFIKFKNLSQKRSLDYLASTIPESVNTILLKNTNLIIIDMEKIYLELNNSKFSNINQYN